MAYNQFTLQKVIADFGLTVQSPRDLYADAVPVPIPAAYRATLARNHWLALRVNTEAARAQLLIGPLIAEVWAAADERLAMYISTRFDVDEAAGLVGVCDYILGLPPQLNFVTAPVLMIAEAKNEDMWVGIGQCAATMVAAQRFNQARGRPDGPVAGVVSDGVEWQLLRLIGPVLEVGPSLDVMADPDRIFGTLLHVCGVAPKA